MERTTSLNYKVSLFTLFSMAFVLVSLESMHAWFLLELSVQLYILTFMLLIGLIFSGPRRITFNSMSLIPISLYAIFSYGIADLTEIKSLIGTTIRIIIVSYIILLKPEYKIKILHNFTSVFILISIIGIPFFALDQFLSVPSVSLVIDNINAQYNNHFVFLSPINQQKIYRYMSVFLEPGYIGMISALLLYALQFNLDRLRTWLLFLLVFISGSTAAYVLVIIGYFFFVISNAGIRINFRKLSSFFLIILSGSFMYSLLTFVPGLAIWEKVVLVFDGGFMEHRLSSNFKAVFVSIDLDTFLYGIGNKAYLEMFPEGGSAGWKVFILKYGLLNLLMLTLFYLSICLQNRRFAVFLFFFLFCFSFSQRAYAMWEVQLLIFICGSAGICHGETLKYRIKQSVRVF